MMQLSRRGHQLLREYEAAHRTPGNKATHYAGIPIIIVAIFGMVREIPVAALPLEANWAQALIVLAGVWYVIHFRIYAAPFLLLMTSLYFISTVNGLAVHLALFVVGWVLQLVGHHRYERKSPSFLDNFVHLLVGPIFLFYSALGKIEEWNKNPLPPPDKGP